MRYELEASGSQSFFGEYENLDSLESELRTASFPGRLSVVRTDIDEEVAFGSQEDALFATKMAKENGFEDIPGFYER